jgi:ankyrin repeat protein
MEKPKIPAPPGQLSPEQKELYNAIFKGNEQAIDNYIKSKADLNIVNREHATPLYEAITFDKESIALKLLNAGADPSIAYFDGITPLRRAILNNGDYHNLLIIKALLDKGITVNDTDKNGDTSLHAAVMSGTPELVSFLIERGADIYARNKIRQTPVTIAAQLQKFPEPNRKEIMEVLKNAMRNRQKKYTQVWEERLHPGL